MMDQAINNFNKQFGYKLKIENKSGFKKAQNYVIVGMGGSHLSAGLLKIWKPSLNLTDHHDYGLPHIPEKEAKKTLVILSSYSGNTEETIDAFHEAGKKGLARIAISVGGKLLELAKSENVPYIQLPDTNIEPRAALGFSFKAFLTIMREREAIKELSKLAKTFSPQSYESSGKELASELMGYVPIIYSSTRNKSLAYIWKITFNETAKIPAFYNVFPELNHNEMEVFNVRPETQGLIKKFCFIFLKDEEDHPRIQKRMDALEFLYRERALPLKIFNLGGETKFHKLFSSVILSDWTAYHIARNLTVDPEAVPLIEEFKKKLSN